jgi:hypothetical protein
MILAIVVAIWAYRRANENGRNGIIWAIAAAATWVGTQLIVSAGAGVAAAIGIEFLGWPEYLYDDSVFTVAVTILAIAMSILSTWLLFRFVLNKPVGADAIHVGTSEAPPPPPTFDREHQ